ncbi:hypothetical protein I7I50_04606 [Histoplasma capsulatum G186AR]|uniref:Uncharacterized protein n=1 Tax=Ajellomyces capsulatus TaxID=5037 RepID=A0A8H7YQW6_AJECA|nr:hypothetical protein I7I52_05515 [Histoplasma capsulatum]QSS75466.1 hypothetical protein I7I50_04606 [Histoplasma capsulatum G186AR]
MDNTQRQRSASLDTLDILFNQYDTNNDLQISLPEPTILDHGFDYSDPDFSSLFDGGIVDLGDLPGEISSFQNTAHSSEVPELTSDDDDNTSLDKLFIIVDELRRRIHNLEQELQAKDR